MEVVAHLIGLIICAIGILVGLIFFVSAINDAKRSRKSLWSKTSGTILSSEWEEKTNDELQKYYRHSISYQYTVDGKIYSSNGVRLGADSIITHNLDRATEVALMYSSGTHVTVFFLKAHPSTSVLEPPTLNATIIRNAIFGAIILITVGFMVYLIVKDLIL